MRTRLGLKRHSLSNSFYSSNPKKCLKTVKFEYKMSHGGRVRKVLKLFLEFFEWPLIYGLIKVKKQWTLVKNSKWMINEPQTTKNTLMCECVNSMNILACMFYSSIWFSTSNWLYFKLTFINDRRSITCLLIQELSLTHNLPDGIQSCRRALGKSVEQLY